MLFQMPKVAESHWTGSEDVTRLKKVAYRALWIAGSLAALIGLGVVDQALTGVRAAAVGI
jgi:hypothetical protein